MNRFKSIVVAVCAIVVAATYALPASAVTSSSSLSIEPRKNYVIQAGKSVSDKMTIQNLDKSNPLNLTLRVIDFTFTNDTGTPKLMLDPNAPQTTWSLKPFLTVPQNVTIAPGQSKTLPISVAIPAGHGAGSYYSAIVYSSGSGSGGNVGLSASGVTLVFASVPGKVSENMMLQKLGSYHEATVGNPAGFSFFNMQEPREIGYTLQNNGNVTESPAGSITLTNLFGQKQVVGSINPNQSLALIGQARTFTACIKDKPQTVNLDGNTSKSTVCDSPGLWPGYYKVSLDAFYGQNGNQTQEIVGNASFWYLPSWFIVAFFVVLIIIIVAVWLAYRKIRAKLSASQSKKSAHRR